MPWITVRRRRRRRRDDTPEVVERSTAQALVELEPHSEEVPSLRRQTFRRGAVELRAQEARTSSEVIGEVSTRENAIEEEKFDSVAFLDAEARYDERVDEALGYEPDAERLSRQAEENEREAERYPQRGRRRRRRRRRQREPETEAAVAEETA